MTVTGSRVVLWRANLSNALRRWVQVLAIAGVGEVVRPVKTSLIWM